MLRTTLPKHRTRPRSSVVNSEGFGFTAEALFLSRAGTEAEISPYRC